MFNFQGDRHSKKNDFDKRVRLAQENASKGRYCIKIQRLFRSFKIRKGRINSDFIEVTKKLSDLKKILGIPQIKSKFFLNEDKLVPILHQFSNSVSKLLLKDNNTYLKTTMDNISNLTLVLECCFNFSHSKAQITNIVHNYINGNKRVQNNLHFLLQKLELLKKITTKTEYEKKCKNKIGEFMGMMSDKERLMSIIGSTVEIPSIQDIKNYLFNLFRKELIICYIESKKYQSVEFVELIHYLKSLGISLKASINNTDGSQNTLNCLYFMFYLSIPSDKQDLDEITELILSIDTSGLKYMFSIFNFSRERLSQVALQDNMINNEEVQVKIIEIFKFSLPNIGSITRKSLISLSNWIYTIFQIRKMEFKQQPKYFQEISNQVVDFMVQLNSQSLSIMKRLCNFLYSKDQFLLSYFDIMTNESSSTLKLDKNSSTINLPTKSQEKWFSLGVDLLFFYLHTHDFQEFFNQGINIQNMNSFFYFLMNLTAYNYLINSEEVLLDDQSNHSTTNPKRSRIRLSKTIKLLFEMNELKNFIPVDYFNMIQLNSYLYNGFLENFKELEPHYFDRFYNFISMFPHCFPFNIRLEIFYNALERELTSKNISHDQRKVKINIRRQNLVSDGIETFTYLLLNGHLYDKIKIVFIDTFGVEEQGQDEGGLYKEFISLLINEVCIHLSLDIRSKIRLFQNCRKHR